MDLQPRRAAYRERERRTCPRSRLLVAVCPLLSRIEFPVIFVTTAPNESRRPFLRLHLLTPRVTIHHPRIPAPPTSLSVCPPSAGLSYEPRSTDSQTAPAASPRSSRALTVDGRVLRCAVSSHGIIASAPPAGLCPGRLFVTGGPEKCADHTDGNSGLIARAHPPHHGGWAVPGGLRRFWPFVHGLDRSRRPPPGMPVPHSERTRRTHDGRFALLRLAPRGLDLCLI